MTSSFTTDQPIPAHSTTAPCEYKYKDSEQPWDPILQSSKFEYGGYYREQLIIVPPAGFDGSEGSFEVGFDEHNTFFYLKIAPHPVLTDPHHIDSLLAQEYKIITTPDSARHQAFCESSQRIADKWYTFRHKLDWRGKPSNDMGRAMPWLNLRDMVVGNRSFPVLIVNISSIEPKWPEDHHHHHCASFGSRPQKLTRKRFRVLNRNRGVASNSSEHPYAELAAGYMRRWFLEGNTPAMMTRKMRETMEELGVHPETVYSMDADCNVGDDEEGKHDCETTKRAKRAKQAKTED